MLAALLFGPVKAVLVAAAVFIPLERLASLHHTQRTFRRGWATDVFTGLMNGFLLYAALLVVLMGIDTVAAAYAPQLRTWIETKPLPVQGVLALVLGQFSQHSQQRLI